MGPIDFLERIWSVQPEGFVFLSLKTLEGEWRDICSAQAALLEKREIPDPRLGDVYFCPNVFSEPYRRKELVLPSRWLYADLDVAVPIENDAELSPTIAVESSPGRYQGYWELDKLLEPDVHDLWCQRLTYALDADKGGWDLTQVLRVPGTINHKYPEKPEVKVLWQ